MPRQAARGRALTVGMFHDGAPRHLSGANVVIQEFPAQIARHAPQVAVRLFAPPGAALPSEGLDPERLSGRLTTDFLEPGAVELDALHEVTAHFDRAFAARRVLGRNLPVTFTHHSFCFYAFMHTWFLAMLLEQSRPYDALVCTAEPARRAIREILDHVSERMRGAHGVKLRFRGRLERIPLGIDTDAFRPRDRRALRLELGLPQDAFILAYVGRLTVSDKADLLPSLRAFRDLVRANPGRQILYLIASQDAVAGNSYARAIDDFALRLGIAEHLLIRRDFKSPEILAAADVFVSPIDCVQESFGLTPIEAMACGTPQIVSDWDGYADTVRDGETGFLIPTRWAQCDRDIGPATAFLTSGLLDNFGQSQAVAVDLGALQRAAQRLLDDPDLRARMGEASRARAMREYSARAMALCFQRLWKSVAAEAARDRRARRDPPSYRDVPFFRALGHYATELVDARTWLRLTAAGRDLLDGREGLPLYFGTPGVLEEPLLRRALDAFGDEAARRRPVRAGAMLEWLGADETVPSARRHSDHHLRHLLWLVKYGFLEVVEGELPTPPPAPRRGTSRRRTRAAGR